MGNICGCVRGPKEDCYVDPKKAPLNPESKELRGRRYFQRRKKTESTRKPVGEVCVTGTTSDRAQGRDGPDGATAETLMEPAEVETHQCSQDSVSAGVYVGEEPLSNPPKQPLSTTCGLGRFPRGSDHSRSGLEEKLHGINTTSSSAKDVLLVRKLLRRQLRRAVSFGAVEHVLQTLRGLDGPVDEESLAKIIWGSQPHRRRPRALSCSGYTERRAKLISLQDEVNHNWIFIADATDVFH